MIIGIGCDIVKVERIRKLVKKFDHNFLRRIFTDNEITDAPENIEQAYNYYAKRFAAKEAFSKALGTGIGSISFNEIEVYNDSSGKPLLRILKEKYNVNRIHLTLSDEKDTALAFVILES